MWYLIIFILIGFAAVFGLTLCQNAITDFNNKTLTSKDSSKTKMNRKEIENQLKNLSYTSVSKNLKMGAMCYSPMAVFKDAIYNCPICGEKTIYSSEFATTVQREIPECRNEIKKIQKIELKLDELQFCKKCNPNITKPQLCIDVNYQGEKKLHHVCDITTQDLKLIFEFTERKVIHKTNNEGEEPLKNYTERIKVLLGIK